MDDTLLQLYRSEIQLRKAAYTATVFAALIVLLGILGLINLSVQRRTREIGIRKVLGAPAWKIPLLFLREFLDVWFMAVCIACPVAFILMQQWLNQYAHHIPIGAGPFLIIVGLLSLLTTVLIGWQTFRIARNNPVESLRSE